MPVVPRPPFSPHGLRAGGTRRCREREGRSLRGWAATRSALRGAVFLDEFTPQAAGDYISGPNHTLPTAGMARVRGGLSVLDFVRIIGCQQVSREGMKFIAPPGIALATAEGLTGHAEAFRVRSHA